MSKISELVDEFEKAHDAFRGTAQKLFHAAFKQFFDENPEIKSVLWCQYTPYFNDGDECIFSVNDMYYSTKIDMIDEVERPDSYGDSEEGEDRFHSAWEKSDNSKSFHDFITEVRQLPDDIFKELFGDHVMILATREGFETEEYEHD